MKKLFLFIAAALVSSSMWADPTYKSDYSDFTAINGSSDVYKWIPKTVIDAVDWIVCGSNITSGSKKYSIFIDPSTGAASTDNTSTDFYRPKDRSGNKHLTFYLTNITAVSFYAYNSSENKTLQAKVNGGDIITLATTSSTTKSIVGTISDLDASTNYTIEIFNQNSSSGASEVFVGAIKVTPPSCAAGDPGNISKGTLSAGVLTLNAAGTAVSGDTWYWQTAENGVDKTNSGSSFNVSAVGTYYIRSYNTAEDCWSDAKSFTVAAADLVANFTVVYMDGTTELGRETVEVGQHPTASAITTTKDFYTFKAWQLEESDVELSAVSAANGETVTLMARYGDPQYASPADLTSSDIVTNKPNVNTYLNGLKYASYITYAEGNYEFTSNETKKGFYGYKVKSATDSLKFLVQEGKQVVVLFGSLKNNPTIKVNGVAQSLDADRKSGDNVENTFTYNVIGSDGLVFIQFGAETSTLKKITTSNPVPTALDNTEEEVKAVKFIKDGQIFIEKNGHVYNVLGGCVK